MTELSPQAQAVLDAAAQAMECDNEFIPYERELMAAALRAAADQVVPISRLPYDSCCDVHAAAIRQELLAIAAELQNQ